MVRSNATQHYTLFIAIHRLVCRPVGLCGVMRIRTSMGISVTGYLGMCLFGCCIARPASNAVFLFLRIPAPCICP
jgi:hypothetical protein